MGSTRNPPVQAGLASLAGEEAAVPSRMFLLEAVTPHCQL